MRRSEWWSRSVLAPLAFAASLTAAPAPERYDLRVFGPLTVTEVSVRPELGAYQQLRLTAADPAKAELTFSKFISDFTTLPTVTAKDVAVGNTPLTALCFDGGRRLLPVLRSGKSYIDLYLFADSAACERFLAAVTAELRGAVKLAGRKHPFYLDRWDRHAMGFWYTLGDRIKERPDLTDDADFAFFRKHDLSVNTARGYVAAFLRCQQNGVGFKINRWFDDSNYAYDACPQAATIGDPDMTTMYDYYGEVPFAENPLERMQAAEMLSYLQQFTADEHLESVTLPHGETGPGAASYQGMRDRDEYSRQDFIHYLRDLRSLRLDELGQRWYGDPKRFAQWSDVRFPREREFYGWKDGESQALNGTWRLRQADRATGEKEEVFQPKFDDSRWLAFPQPGSQYLANERGGDRLGGWLRFAFTPEPVIGTAAKSGKPVYLTVCPFNSAPYSDPSMAYLNGQKLGEMTFGHGNEWSQYEVTKLVKPGAVNALTVYARHGHVTGPTFLTLNKFEPFPTRDAGVNARLYDVREWVADCVARGNLRYLEYLRGIDPVRPVKIMAFDSMVDVMMPYAERQGAYPHCTGESAFFRPWFKRYGYLRGVPDSSEPSQSTANLAQLKGLFFCMTMEGLNAHDYFIHLHSITADPEQNAWYEQNVEYYKLMGRFDLKKPEIVIARSAKVDRVSPQGTDTAYQNDPGRGDIQKAHYGYLFCSERDIRDGLVDDYKIIVDANLHTLEPADIAALDAWVNRGGTLVLNQRSGRNTYLQAGTWPIAKLTGCTATVRPETGNVTFAANPAILKAYAGKSFANANNLYDWQKRHYFSDCVALEPQAADIAVVARYDDGKPAVVVRPLGKGRVVVLGSAFYRDSHDIAGYFEGTATQTAFYQELFKDLGVAPLVESAQSTLWAERFIANNGSTEMLVLGNQSAQEPLANASAVWDLGFAPRRVFDPVTGTDLPVKIDGTRVTIAGLNLPPRELRYYAVERSDWDAAAPVRHWLFRQSQLWRAVPAGRAVPPMDPSWPLRVLGKVSVKQFESEAEARLALSTQATADATWQARLLGDWASAGLRTGKNLWAVYRTTLQIDRAWLKDLRGVEPLWDTLLSGSVREMAINGVLIIKDDRPVNGDKILAALKPGANEFTVLCAARGDTGNGGISGEFALRRIPGAGGEALDLNRGWTVYASETDSYRVDFPAVGKWLLARKSVLIPEQYRGSTVWIEIRAKDSNHATGVSMNGRYRYDSNCYGCKFRPTPLLVNITPDVRFGEENDLVIGGKGWHDKFALVDSDFESVKLIFEKN